MHLILLSGGSGKRLWPLSNEVRSKQFIKVFPVGEDGHESMLQRVYRQIRGALGEVPVTVATAKAQVSGIRNQLSGQVDISVEPCRRDTFPAILLSALFLRDVKHVPLSEAVLVCPIDPYVEEGYFLALKEMEDRCIRGGDGLTLMGIQPTYPSEKYGYILLENDGRTAKGFKEKPDAELAAEYIRQGALWNSGVFAFRLGYLLERAREVADFDGYEDLLSRYASLPKVSFDYAIVEHETKIQVIPYAGTWKDLGTWNTLTEAMTEHEMGDVLLSDSCRNVHVLNALDIPILCMGLKDAVISASPDGILVSDKEQSSYIKPYVDRISQPVMFAEKSWGTYQVLDAGEESLTIKVTLESGHGMRYHRHEHRDETWNVIAGEGHAVLDGKRIEVRAGDFLNLPRGCSHRLVAHTRLQAIEVQMGKDISVKDKVIVSR